MNGTIRTSEPDQATFGDVMRALKSYRDYLPERRGFPLTRPEIDSAADLIDAVPPSSRRTRAFLALARRLERLAGAA